MAATSCGEVEKVAGVYRLDPPRRTSDSACYRSVLDRFSPQRDEDGIRIMAAAEALVALVAAFLPLSGEQVAALLGIVAVVTGERVVRKVKAS